MTLRIYGTPVAQGSMKGFPVQRQGRMSVVVTAHNAAQLKPWRQEIASAALAAGMTPQMGPLRLTLTFYLRRPPSRPKKYTEVDKRPDLDKLTRTVCDALTSVAWQDDAQIVALEARKVYATEKEPEGVAILVTRSQVSYKTPRYHRPEEA